jgi:ABC-type multidrug transport system ATPase subunit
VALLPWATVGAPLLATDDLRIDVGGVAAIDGLAMATGQDVERVVVIGAPRALFDATCGLVKPSRGTIAVQGISSVEAMAHAGVAGAPVDPPMPADWSPLDYVTWSARLVGMTKGEATARAASALDRIGIRGEAHGLLGRAPVATKRATSIAAALATGARVIALEDPTASLDDDAAHAVARHVVRALEGRAWILFAARAPLASDLVASCAEALVIAGSACVESGPPAELAARARTYAVDAHGDVEALAAKLASRVLRVESRHVAHRSARFVVELAPGETTYALFACAEEVGAVVVELRPIARAFA